MFPSIWGISRFAVDTASGTNGFLGHLTADRAAEFALARGLGGYVAVTDMRVERIAPVGGQGCDRFW
ncbi:MAG: hypothetical protein AAF982_07710 [Pseudomonadota bacterium]